VRGTVDLLERADAPTGKKLRLNKSGFKFFASSTTKGEAAPHQLHLHSLPQIFPPTNIATRPYFCNIHRAWDAKPELPGE
jgi:hypothetical protein